MGTKSEAVAIFVSAIYQLRYEVFPVWRPSYWLLTSVHIAQCLYCYIWVPHPWKHGYSRWNFNPVPTNSWDKRYSSLSATIFNLWLPVCQEAHIRSARWDSCFRKSLDTRTVDFCPILVFYMSLKLYQTCHSIFDYILFCSPKFVAMPASGGWSRDHVQILILSDIYIRTQSENIMAPSQELLWGISLYHWNDKGYKFSVTKTQYGGTARLRLLG